MIAAVCGCFFFTILTHEEMSFFQVSGVNNVGKHKSELLCMSRWDKVSVVFFFPQRSGDEISALCVFISRRSSGTWESKVTVYRSAACCSGIFHHLEFRSCTSNINIDTRLKEISLTASINLLPDDLNPWLVINQPLELISWSDGRLWLLHCFNCSTETSDSCWCKLWAQCCKKVLAHFWGKSSKKNRWKLCDSFWKSIFSRRKAAQPPLWETF